MSNYKFLRNFNLRTVSWQPITTPGLSKVRLLEWSYNNIPLADITVFDNDDNVVAARIYYITEEPILLYTLVNGSLICNTTDPNIKLRAEEILPDLIHLREFTCSSHEHCCDINASYYAETE